MSTDTGGLDVSSKDRQLPGQVVLVLQGGGALGAYQIGVYDALHQALIEPDWVIGTSIGAINAALIVGNAKENRVEKLTEFWRRMEPDFVQQLASSLPFFGAAASNMMTMANGISNFFQPNPLAFLGGHLSLGAEATGYYSTQALEQTLADLVDFDLINQGPVRLTIGAAKVRTSEMRYFDSRDMPLSAKHIMASGALPPAFPPIRIDGELYWDGGILSNTPVEAVFDDNPRRDALVFAVHIWNPEGKEPDTMGDVMHRQKEVQYSSRAGSHIARQKQIHKLRHVIRELSEKLPAEARSDAEARELASFGCVTRMHVVRLLAPGLDGEDHTKDIDFSTSGIKARRLAGYEDTRRILDDAPWQGEFDPLEGFILHEAYHGRQTKSG